MNLRCIYCQTPFTLSRMEKLAAIQKLQAEGLHHHDAFCPRCRRSNPVSIDRLRIFTPGWLEGLRTLEAEAAQRDKEQLALATVAPVASNRPAMKAPASTAHKKRHSSAAARKATAAAKAKPAPKKKPAAAPKKKTAATSSPKAKPAPTKAKKPAAKPAAKSKRK